MYTTIALLTHHVENLREGPVEHSVPMDRLLDGLQSPPDLSHRIGFDADRRRRVFRGFMSKSEFNHLCQLSNDWGYRRP